MLIVEIFSKNETRLTSDKYRLYRRVRCLAVAVGLAGLAVGAGLWAILSRVMADQTAGSLTISWSGTLPRVLVTFGALSIAISCLHAYVKRASEIEAIEEINRALGAIDGQKLDLYRWIPPESGMGGAPFLVPKRTLP